MTTHIPIADSSSLSLVGSKSTMPRNRADLFAITGGLMQMVLAFGLLFLPIFATCLLHGQEWVCQRQSYIQQGGSVLGYAFLVLMIVAGSLVLASIRLERLKQHAHRVRWIAVLLTAGFAIIGTWSIGLLFVPGGLFLLLSAFSSD
jgi:hypothetical protein